MRYGPRDAVIDGDTVSSPSQLVTPANEPLNGPINKGDNYKGLVDPAFTFECYAKIRN